MFLVAVLSSCRYGLERLQCNTLDLTVALSGNVILVRPVAD